MGLLIDLRDIPISRQEVYDIYQAADGDIPDTHTALEAAFPEMADRVVSVGVEEVSVFDHIMSDITSYTLE